MWSSLHRAKMLGCWVARLGHRQNGPLTFSTSSFRLRNYYEILGVKKNCSQADIKRAFLQLSKEVHPDMRPAGQASSQHDKFIVLSNAYTTLSKPGTRSQYDYSLAAPRPRPTPRPFRQAGDIVTDAPEEVFRDSSFYENRDRSADERAAKQPYYGVAFIKERKSNSFIAMLSLVFMMFGIAVHYYVGAAFVSFYQRRTIQKDAKIALSYKAVRDRALSGSSEERIAAFRQKLQLEKEALGGKGLAMASSQTEWLDHPSVPESSKAVE